MQAMLLLFIEYYDNNCLIQKVKNISIYLENNVLLHKICKRYDISKRII